MKTRTLGSNGPTVSALGLGCMGMSAFYGSADEQEGVATIQRAQFVSSACRAASTCC